MLGDAAKPGWSLKREKDVVDTLLELLTAGLMPRKRLEALDLNGLGVSVPGTSAWFLTGGALLPTPATLLPPPRASRASLQEGALAALDMSAPTGKKVPLPRWAAKLTSLHVDLGRAALAEHLVVRHSALATHQDRGNAEVLPVELAAATIEAITPGQRVFAVVAEEVIKGQVNRESAFWSKVPGGVRPRPACGAPEHAAPRQCRHQEGRRESREGIS